MTEVMCGRDSWVWKEEREQSIRGDPVGPCRKFGFSFANENFKQRSGVVSLILKGHSSCRGD